MPVTMTTRPARRMPDLGPFRRARKSARQALEIHDLLERAKLEVLMGQSNLAIILIQKAQLLAGAITRRLA